MAMLEEGQSRYPDAPPSTPQRLDKPEAPLVKSDPRKTFTPDSELATYDDGTPLGGGLTWGDVRDWVNRCWREDDDRMKPLQAIQDRLWQLYRNFEDWSDKEDWQSRIAVPKAYSAIKQAAAQLRKLMNSSDRWVMVDGFGTMGRAIAPIVEQATNTLMKSKSLHLMYPLIDAWESSMAIGVAAWRVEPETALHYTDVLSGSQPENQARLKVRNLDYRRFKFGPNTTPYSIDRFIEDLEVPYSYLSQSKNRFRNLAFLERDNFAIPQDETRDDARFDINDQINRKRVQLNIVNLREYWGDICNIRTQEVVARDVHIGLLDRKYVGFLRKIPYWHTRKKPYIIFSPLHVAYRFPGCGILEAVRDIFRGINRIANLQMDGLEYALLKQFEVDMSLLENPGDLATGIEPGKFYRKRMGTNSLPAIREIEVSDIKAGGMEAMQLWDREIQRGSFITDQVQGLTGSKGETTATEVTEAAQGTDSMLLSIALDLEDMALTPLAEMLFDLAVQYFDSGSDPNWEKLLGADMLDKMTREQRRRLIGDEYELNFRGLSQAIINQEKSKRIMESLQLVGSNPLFAQVVNVPRMFTDLLKSIGSADYVLPNAEARYAQALQQEQAQAQAQQQQKVQQMGQQFQMRQQAQQQMAMVKHGLSKDMAGYKAGLKMATEQPTGGEHGVSQ